MTGTFWHIWSIEHNAWWAPNHSGYTKKKAEAGLYIYDEALRIVADANRYTKEFPNEAMVQHFLA